MNNGLLPRSETQSTYFSSLIQIILGEGVTFQITTVNPKHIVKDPKTNRSNKTHINRVQSVDRIQKEGLRERDGIKRDEQFQKMIGRDFLSFFSASRMINLRANTREEWSQHLKCMLKHIYLKANTKPNYMGNYEGLYKYYYKN